MQETAMWWKSRWSDPGLLVLAVPVWGFTVYDLVTRHLPMNRGFGESMALLVLPMVIWKTTNRLRRKTG
jgi:hypothetical protein